MLRPSQVALRGRVRKREHRRSYVRLEHNHRLVDASCGYLHSHQKLTNLATTPRLRCSAGEGLSHGKLMSALADNQHHCERYLKLIRYLYLQLIHLFLCLMSLARPTNCAKDSLLRSPLMATKLPSLPEWGGLKGRGEAPAGRLRPGYWSGIIRSCPSSYPPCR